MGILFKIFYVSIIDYFLQKKIFTTTHKKD